MEAKNIHNMADIKGLTSLEAKKRLEKYGLNEIPEKDETMFHRIFKRFWGPIPWMIEVAAVLSAAVKKWEDLTIIVIMLLTNAVLDFYQESKALNAIKALKKSLAQKSLVLRDGKWIGVEAKEIVPGDIIKLKIGDIVPADAKLLEGDYILADMSALTGESLPVTKKVGDEIYGNAIIKKGDMLAEVTKTGLDTYFGQTVKLVARAEKEQKSHFQKMVISVGNFLILITLALIAVIIFVGLFRHENIFDLLEFSLVLTVAAIPVALPAVLTVTMAVGAVNLAKKHAIVSRLQAIEELAGMDILCSDKTGTLTKNEMTISDPYTLADYTADDVLLYGALASKEENDDPIEKPIFAYVKEKKLDKKLSDYHLKKFAPFDPVSKRTEAEFDSVTVTKGAPQVIIEISKKDFDEQKLNSVVHQYAQKGFRTLGVAIKKKGENDYTLAGLIPLYDPPREDSINTIADLKAHGVEVKMVTGDNLAVAQYIAGVLDIGTDIENINQLKGHDTKEYDLLAKIISQTIFNKVYNNKEKADEYSDEVVKEVQKELENVPLPKGHIKQHESQVVEIIENANGFAQVFPKDKYFIVDKLQKAKHIVGMTGDGVNDAPALKKADCGIAVSGATDAARASADIVLIMPGLQVINDAVKQARITFERMKGYTIYRITETIRVILFMTASIVIFQFYPVTALMIIILALLNDIPILSIAYDNTRINMKPVSWDMSEVLILSSWLGFAGVISSFLAFFLLKDYFKLPDELIQSIIFMKLIVAGHGTVYNTRTTNWFWKKPFPAKILFNASLLSALIGTIIAVYGFGLLTPTGWRWAGLTWVYALIWFVFNDIVKMSVIKFFKRRGKLNI